MGENLPKGVLMTYLGELIRFVGFVDLGICEPETKQFGRHLFCDFCPRNIWSHVGFDVPQELLRPEIEFPLPISLSSVATWTDSFSCLLSRAKGGLKRAVLQALVLEIILWVEGSHNLGGFDEEPGQVEQGSGEGLEEGLGGIGAEPGQVQQGCGEGSGEDSGHLGGFGAEPGQIQQSVYLRPLNSRKATWRVSSAWFGSTLQKNCKKMLPLLGIPPKLIYTELFVSLCTYVHMHMCIYLYMYWCKYIYIYIYIYIHICIYVYVVLCIHFFSHMYMYMCSLCVCFCKCACICWCICIGTCVCICVCMCIYIYIYCTCM